jgi:hypothetical protein
MQSHHINLLNLTEIFSHYYRRLYSIAILQESRNGGGRLHYHPAALIDLRKATFVFSSALLGCNLGENNISDLALDCLDAGLDTGLDSGLF